MNRITEIEIAGKKYPLNFSTKAVKEITARYGDIANVGNVFAQKSTDKMMDEVVWLLALLIDQGVKYKKIVESENVSGISAEDLEIVLGVADFGNLQSQIMGSMLSGMSRTVETEEDSKNAKTTQG